MIPLSIRNLPAAQMLKRHYPPLLHATRRKTFYLSKNNIPAAADKHASHQQNTPTNMPRPDTIACRQTAPTNRAGQTCLAPANCTAAGITFHPARPRRRITQTKSDNRPRQAFCAKPPTALSDQTPQTPQRRPKPYPQNPGKSPRQPHPKTRQNPSKPPAPREKPVRRL